MKYSLQFFFFAFNGGLLDIWISILAFAASRAMTVIAQDNTHEQSSKRILAQQII